ncbi:hypothetical protein KIF24_05455 [Micromonospora sp. Llam7]|uniref:hypothetical protein n=1 Tax=Micromonospora tarapacensis TaxID=2835305 RepID=UPI001C83A1DF|nr:hypothetical protein [Micromonospora tarapacensis]MBX7265544.1 hypothetical protein [Micromonospora tarapacensis]
MAVYLSAAILDELAAAQTTINQHVTGCARCGTNNLCYDRIEAERVFLRYDRLPHRTPGLTRS